MSKKVKIWGFWQLLDSLSRKKLRKSLKPHMKGIVIGLFLMRHDANFDDKKIEYARRLLNEIIVPDCVPKKYRNKARDMLAKKECFDLFCYRVIYIIHQHYRPYILKKGDQ